MSALDRIFEVFEKRTNFETNFPSGALTREYRLDRMKFLCRAFGNPQNDFDVVHVAGSKGKGSTAAYIASLLAAGGRRVGIYSSPHLIDYRERFRIQGRDFPEPEAINVGESLLENLKRIEKELVGESPATTFELLTLFCFLFFRENDCDVVVLETGLGGRLDATNVVENPLAVVLTPVEMEHVEILGPELSDIAAEKAGIMKKGAQAWTAKQAPEVRKVFLDRARDLGVKLHSIEDDLVQILPRGDSVFSWGLSWKNGQFDTVELAMGGRVQAENAALALAVVRQILPEIPSDTLKFLADVHLPGRFQVIRPRPLVVLDGAHTPNSIRNVCESFLELYRTPDCQPPILLFGSADGKDHRGMAEILCGGPQPLFPEVIISTPGYFKPSSPSDVAEIFSSFPVSCELILDPEKAWKNALLRAGTNRGILVTGSFFMAGEIAKILGKTSL